MREVVGVRVGVRGEIELELGGEDGCEGGGGLGGAGEGERLEGGLGVDVHVALVDGPARAERRARAAGVVAVVVLVGGDVGGGAGEGEEGVVVREEVGFGDAELEVEDVEELTLDAADVALAEDPRAQRPVNVLKRGIVRGLLGTVDMWSRVRGRAYAMKLARGGDEAWGTVVERGGRSAYAWHKCVTNRAQSFRVSSWP